MTTKMRNWLLAIFILGFPFTLFLGFLIFMEEPLPPLAPLPNPNGYEDLVKAGKMLQDEADDYDKMSRERLQKAVSANATAVSLARTGMSNQCRVPVQYTEAFNSNHLNDLAEPKRLARAFIAEGRLAEIENRPADAAKSYLDTIHLANEATRGGLLIDGLVGMAIESSGTDHLQKLVPQLDASTCRATAAAIETLDAQRQTWSEIRQQETTWSHATFRSWRYELMRWMSRKSAAAAIAKIGQKFDAQEQKTRHLIITLAAHAYELEKGKPPGNAADLVPDYLKAVPQDPVTGTNMVYSPR